MAPRLFQRLVDRGTGRLPANSTLDRGRYLILGTIGKGGMGAVYVAQDTQLLRTVAIKEMSQGRLKDARELQQARQRFQQEANILKALQHTNLPQVYDSFQENKRSYLVMEYIQGQSLFEVLKHMNGSPLSLERVVDYGLQLCDVLHYLHTHYPPVVFRDLKPSNVMLRADGRIFLVDFGIARFFYKDRHHRETEVFATPGYAPPEQYAGQTTPQSDLFSLGATLHQCLTGQNPQSHTEMHLFHFPPANSLNPQVPLELSLLVQEMLSTQPHERPVNAYEVQQRLNQLHLQLANPIVLSSDEPASPFAPTINPNMPRYGTTTLPKRSLGSRLSALLIGLGATCAFPFVQVVGGLRWNRGRHIDQALSAFWQQQLSQVIELSRNGRIWTRQFTLFWFVTLLLIFAGSTYLLKTVPEAPRLIALALIFFSLCMSGFYLSEERLTDPVPRTLLALISVALLLAGLALQALPDMEALIRASLQSATFNQLGAFVLFAGGVVCVLRPGQRLPWVEPVLLSFLTLGCAILYYGFGLDALHKAFPQFPVDLAQTLNPFLIGTLVVPGLLALFRASGPLRGWSCALLVLVAVVLTLIQYTSGFQEFQHFLTVNDDSNAAMQHLIALSFFSTWAPITLALLALCIRRGWAIRLALCVAAEVEAIMFAYQGQGIRFAFFPGNTYPLSINALNVSTISQLAAPVLVLVVCVTLFRLPRTGSFKILDHGALLVSVLICAHLDEAFWQNQSAPLSMQMDQSAVDQQFTILAGQIPVMVIYLLLFGLPLALLAFAGCHLWAQSHPLARLDPWFKRLWSALILMERLLVLALASIALILQGFAGTFKSVVNSGVDRLFTSNPSVLDIVTLLLLLVLTITGLVILVRLFARTSREAGKVERFALLLAALSCLLLIGQNRVFAHLPLLSAQIQLTGNILHWPVILLNLLFIAGLLLAPFLASLWLRRSFFARYRELLGLAFVLVMACAVLQFFWSALLPLGLMLFIPSVLLAIQIERAE